VPGNSSPEQLQLRAYYYIRVAGGSMFDIQAVSIYLCNRYAKEGRAGFIDCMNVEARLTKEERRLFWRYLRRNKLERLMKHKDSVDEGSRRKRGKEDGKEGDGPGGESIPPVAAIDWGATPLFRRDAEGE
jgi:hypothetical protein